MPEIITFDNIGQQGINTDVAAWSLPPDFITEGRNFRVFANQIFNSGGASLWSEAPVSFNPGFIYHVGGTSSNFWVVCGVDAVYAFDGTNWSDISSTAGYDAISLGQETFWNACQMGRIPVFNHYQIHPEYWSPQSPTQELQPLPWVAGTSTWEEVNQQCNVIRSHNNFMWALDLIDNGEEIQDGVRWSHPADINGLPPSWDETDPNYLAGKIALGGDTGRVIDGRSLRNQFVVYSEGAINIFDEAFTSEFVWNRRELSSTIGLLSLDALVEIKGNHLFLAPGDAVINNGTSVESIMHNRLRRRMSSNMNVDFYKRSFVLRNDAYKEIWFCVPEGTAEYPNIAYVYNWKDESWAIRDIPESSIVHANYGSYATPTRTWDTWNGNWNSQNGFWGSRSLSPTDDTVVGVDSENSRLYILDVIDDQPEFDSILERTDFPLDGQVGVTTITRVYPHMNGTQSVDIQFGSQDHAGSPVRWKPPVKFDPSTDRKIDVRTTGELHAWRITSRGTGRYHMSGMTIEYEKAGVR